MSAVVALVGVGLANLAGGERAEATHSVGTGGPANSDGQALHVDFTNTTTNGTVLKTDGNAHPALNVFNGAPAFEIGQADGLQGITRKSGGFVAGVHGRHHTDSGQGIGVLGLTKSVDGTGVYGGSGLAQPPSVPTEAAGVGVFGNGVHGVRGQASTGTGVFGLSMTGVGVGGVSDNLFAVWGKSVNSLGVFGESVGNSGVEGHSTSGAGVFGLSQNNAAVFGTSPFAGVAGLSSNNAGVQGTSTNGGGVVGQSTNNAGVFGTSSNIGVWGTTSTGTGVFGQATNANGFAGQFAGRVFVSGSFTVVNGAKSAAVKRKDGSHARVYCQESPEPWFEDFGAGQLVGGRAIVQLGSDFAEVVRADDYAVFPIPEGDCNGLYVANKAPQSFEVRELRAGTSGVPFRYRVVARRADPVGTRMEKVDLPTPPQAAQAPRVLSADELPKPPARPNERPAAPGRDR